MAARRPRSASGAPWCSSVARPPATTATVGPGASSGAAWSSAIRIDQPPSGGSPATAMSPPSDTSTPRRGERRAAAAAARSAASAFAVAPRSSSTPAGRAHGAARPRRARLRHPAAGANDGRRGARRGVARRMNGPVVAGKAQRAADRRIDEPAGDLGRARARRAARRAGARSTRPRCPPQRLSGDELGVVAKAAAGEIDRLELAHEQRARGLERALIGDDEHRGRAERRERAGAHDPPEVATGAE